MNTFTSLCVTSLCVTTLLTTSAFAQTHLVRGDVDSIQGSNLFQLECTTVQLVSSTLNLKALHDASRQKHIEYEMQVKQLDSNPQILDVVSATAVPRTFDMGGLQFGRSEKWEVFGAPGSTTAVFIALRSQTVFEPVGPAGAWLLGPSFGQLMSGMTDSRGRFQFQFEMPKVPGLVGTEISAQAAVVDAAGSMTLTSPDSRVVRAD